MPVSVTLASALLAPLNHCEISGRAGEFDSEKDVSWPGNAVGMVLDHSHRLNPWNQLVSLAKTLNRPL